jgi:hypothetical protein
MRALLVMVVGLGLGGCCPPIIHGPEVAPPPGAELAIDIVEAEYQEAFGREVAVGIVWVASLDDYEGHGVIGAANDCVELFVVLWAGAAPSDTSMAHEMAHCWAAHIPDSGCDPFSDDSHSEEWLWGASGLVEAVDNRLAGMGL